VQTKAPLALYSDKGAWPCPHLVGIPAPLRYLRVLYLDILATWLADPDN